MANAFQSVGFQHLGFQGGLGQINPPPLVTPTGGIGRVARRRLRHKIEVEIDGEVFEVRSEAEGVELLRRAREAAKEAARRAADAAAAKAATKESPAAVKRALTIPVPLLRVIRPDYSDQLTQAIQAQIEAARADIERDYALAMQLARAYYERELDDEEVTILLL